MTDEELDTAIANALHSVDLGHDDAGNVIGHIGLIRDKLVAEISPLFAGEREVSSQLRGAILAIHESRTEEAEVWIDGPGEDTHRELFPDCTDCEGHTLDIRVCSECGYDHDGDQATYRKWPCPTVAVASYPLKRGRAEMSPEDLGAIEQRMDATSIRPTGDNVDATLHDAQELLVEVRGLRAREGQLNQRVDELVYALTRVVVWWEDNEATNPDEVFAIASAALPPAVSAPE